MFSKKEFAIVSNLRFISKTNFMLSSIEFCNLGVWVCTVCSGLSVQILRVNMVLNCNFHFETMYIELDLNRVAIFLTNEDLLNWIYFFVFSYIGCVL